MSRIDTPRKLYAYLLKQGITKDPFAGAKSTEEFERRLSKKVTDKQKRAYILRRLEDIGGPKAVWEWVSSLPGSKVGGLEEAKRHALLKLPKGPFRVEADEYQRGDDDMPLRSLQTRARTMSDAALIYEEFRLAAEKRGNGNPGQVSGGRVYKGQKRVATVTFDGDIISFDGKTLYLGRDEIHV